MEMARGSDMSALISKELRVEVLSEAKKKNARTVESVKQMYWKQIERSKQNRGLSTEARQRLRKKIDAKVDALVAL